MVISPMLRGLFGLQFDAQAYTLTFTPHVPADWSEFAIRRVAAGNDSVNLHFSRKTDSLTITAEREGDADLKMDFRPALSPRAEVLGVTFNGRRVAFRLEPHDGDQHLIVETNLKSGQNTLEILLHKDFAVTYRAHLPALGSASQGLRIVAETWSASRDVLTLQTEGLSGRTYTLAVSDKEQIRSIDGAKLMQEGLIEEAFPAANGSSEPQTQTVTIHFVNGAKQAKQTASSHNN